ncbi:hypothetical protein BV912_10080 [Neisseria dumasiana]|uniref:Lipoprotein signal peptidase n=1 Tax=Neisseria dumasiana TaxID=1931275 RepID=A0A1X3DEP9_9NEIS|nr:hypothetical protein [Neisseria dumasiana]OSI18255.1 hypothetical protein BV912_10080 [Neisseria dumasiana]
MFRRPETFAKPHLRRISALCAARSFAYLCDMSALAVLLRLELHPHLVLLQRSQPARSSPCFTETVIYNRPVSSALRLFSDCCRLPIR